MNMENFIIKIAVKQLNKKKNHCKYIQTDVFIYEAIYPSPFSDI